MTLEEMLRLTGFKQVGGDQNAFGRGLLFGFPAEAATKKKTLTFICGVDAVPDSKQFKAIKQRLKGDECTKGKVTVTSTIPGDESSTGGNFFVITVTLGKDDPSPWYERAMCVVEAALREEGVVPPVQCPICERPGGDTLAYYDGRPAIVHMSCLRQWKDAQQERLELKKQNSGYVRGILGGLIGGIVGAIPALLAMVIFNILAALLFALIPMGIYFGWKLLGGKLSRVTTVFTIICALVLTLVVEVIFTWLYIRAESIPDFMLPEVIDWYLNPDIFMDILLWPLLQSLFFSALGIVCAWRMIIRTDQHELSDVQTVFDEAIPIDTISR